MLGPEAQKSHINHPSNLTGSLKDSYLGVFFQLEGIFGERVVPSSWKRRGLGR